MELNLKKKNTGLLAGITVAVILLAVVLMFVFSGGSNNKLKEQLNLGNKYMQEMDYEQAVAAYLAAIEIDDKCVDAYLGAAEAYLAMGDGESALSILIQGYELTGDERLEAKMGEVIELLEGNSFSEEEEQFIEEEQVTVEKGAVYLVELADPDMMEAAREYYEWIQREPYDPYPYIMLNDVYLGAGEGQAALDVLNAGYDRTENEELLILIDAVKNMGEGNVSSTGTVEDSSESKTVKPESNQFIISGTESGAYLVTYDKEMVRVTSSKDNGAEVFFDLSRVEQKLSLTDNYNSFDDYYNEQKKNIEDGIDVSEVSISEPYQISCGNVIVNRFNYSYAWISEKEGNEKRYEQKEVFYIDLGNGVGIYGSSEDFIEGYSYYRQETGSIHLTLDDFLAYVFINVEKIE